MCLSFWRNDDGTETGRNVVRGIYKEKPLVANIGIMLFYQALVDQKCECVQINWTPEYKQSEEIQELLDEFL